MGSERVILLDTHIWMWWVTNNSALAAAQRRIIESNQDEGLGVSAISCWEVAKKVELGKLLLDRDVDAWIDGALSAPGVRLLGLSPEVLVESTRLPQPFHRDPADQIIVATSRVHDIPILTSDARIQNYGHVTKVN